MRPHLWCLFAIPPPTQDEFSGNFWYSDPIDDGPHVSIWAVAFELDPMKLVAVAVVEWYGELGSSWAFAISLTMGIVPVTVNAAQMRWLWFRAIGISRGERSLLVIDTIPAIVAIAGRNGIATPVEPCGHVPSLTFTAGISNCVPLSK